MTLNQLIVIFRDIATRHKQVHSFKMAQDFNIDAEEALRFPCLVINPTASQLPKTDNGYSMYSVTFDVQLLDLMNKDRDNEDDVMSDNLTILREIVNEFNTHPYYMDSGIDLVGNISFSTIRGAYDSDVTGWRCTMEMQSPNRLSFCGSPIENLTGYDFSAAAVTVNDGEDTYELYPSDIYTCSSGITPSGIAYQRPKLTGQTTSYRTGDDAWHLANGTYDYTPPINPVYLAELDTTALEPFKTLKNNNTFGNLERFTDDLGTQIYANNYVIDHLTGLGIYSVAIGVDTWDDNIDNAAASTQNSFNDWRVANFNELKSLQDYDGTTTNGITISGVVANRLMSSTTRIASSTTAFYIFWTIGYGSTRGKAGTETALLIRNHF